APRTAPVARCCARDPSTVCARCPAPPRAAPWRAPRHAARRPWPPAPPRTARNRADALPPRLAPERARSRGHIRARVRLHARSWDRGERILSDLRRLAPRQARPTPHPIPQLLERSAPCTRLAIAPEVRRPRARVDAVVAIEPNQIGHEVAD